MQYISAMLWNVCAVLGSCVSFPVPANYVLLSCAWPMVPTAVAAVAAVVTLWQRNSERRACLYLVILHEGFTKTNSVVFFLTNVVVHVL